jgi:nucleoside-diphosphate-sugar epimerase
MRILIIGGTRFIGPPVVRSLVEKGHDVALFHRGETESILPDVIRHLHGDRRELASFALHFSALKPDVVLDMFPYTEEDARLLMSVFKDLTRRIVAVSSSDVYRAYGRLLRMEDGPPDPVPLAEDAPLRTVFYPHRTQAEGPNDYKYQYEKILVERVVMNDPDLPGTVLRLPAVYGPGDPQHRLFGYLRRMNDKRPHIVLGEGQARWRWTRGYVENVADAIALAVTNERASNRIYNVGQDDAPTEAEWISKIAKIAGWDGEVVSLPMELLPEHLQTASDHEHHLVTDTGRIREELGYDESVPFDEGLRRTIEWERAHPPLDMHSVDEEYAAEDAAVSQYRRRVLECGD